MTGDASVEARWDELFRAYEALGVSWPGNADTSGQAKPNAGGRITTTATAQRANTGR